MPESRRSHAAPSRGRRRAIGLVVGAVVILLLAAGGVFAVQSGWFPGFGAGQGTAESPAVPEDPSDPSSPTEPTPPVEFTPDGTAEENLPYFTQTLEAFAASGQPVEGVPLVDAVFAAGFDRNAMQVSFDRTKTDLVADSIFVSVRIGAECLLGQVTTGTREVSAVTEPAIGPNRDICLIGNTRAIDW